jgi:hypothetical protein
MVEMRILFLSLILITTAGHAQKNLTAQVFQSNVTPVLKGVINDFYQMISLFPDYPKGISGIVNQLDSMEEVRRNLKLACPRTLNKKCQKSLDKIRNQINQIEAKTFELTSRQMPGESVYLNNLIGMRLLSDFHAELYAFKGSLDNTSFLQSAGIKEKRQTHRLLKKMDQLQTMFSLVIVEFVPYQYKEIFRHFYFNFVRPLEVQLSKHKNHEFFFQNMNSLNFTINLMNQKLTKRSKKTPEGMVPYLSLIHNRWNSILRYYW